MRPAILFCFLTAALLPWGSFDSGRCNACDEPPVTSENEEEDQSDEGNEQLNLAFKTTGGTQLWTDHLHRNGYRIQQNALTGHWRLLDANNVRQGWGTEKHCEALLDQVCPAVESDTPKHVVVLVHGLMRTRGSMKPLEAKLMEGACDEVLRFSYASTRASIADHAQALRDVLEEMPDNTQFSFVGHSMGNIVVRHMLGDLQKDDPTGLLSRFRSMVMLGPPNQGAAIARRLAPTGLFGMVTGKGALELGPQWEELEQRLAIPSFPFVIVAGDLSHNPIQNPLVDGSSDLIVSVDEAKLAGAECMETVPVVHSFLMNDEKVQDLTAEFIQAH